MPQPRWIVFDAVGTLITPQPTVAEAYAAVGKRYGVNVPVDVVRQRFRTAFRESETACFAPDRRGCTSEAEEYARWQWIVCNVLSEATDLDACFHELWDHFAEPKNWRSYDDVAPTLTSLRNHGIGIAMASNFDERLHRVRDGLPELARISRVFVSSSLGARKPDPQFYRQITQELGVDPDELLMVGDDPDCDVAGPLQVGWQARQLDRGASPEEDRWRSLHELTVWLDHNGAT